MRLELSEDTKIYRADAEAVFEAVKKVCKKSGLSVTSIDPVIRRIEASTGPSLISWGENVEIIVSPRIEGAAVNVRSTGKHWLNIGALPQTERNVKDIFRRLDEEIGEGKKVPKNGS